MADFFLWISRLGNWQVAGIIAILFSFYLYHRGLLEKLKWFWVTVAGAELTTHIIKVLIARPRPEGGLILETGYSFPSGHAVIAVALYGLVAYFLYVQGSTLTGQGRTLASQGPTFLLVSLVALIGYSRFYLGAHYISDILGGYFIGLIWLFIGQRLARVL